MGAMNAKQIAKALGRRGGLARSKKLSAEQRKAIASRGGHGKALNAKAAQRIVDNFIYLDVLRELRKVPQVKSVSRTSEPLPGIYAKKRSD